VRQAPLLPFPITPLIARSGREKKKKRKGREKEKRKEKEPSPPQVSLHISALLPPGREGEGEKKKKGEERSPR